MPVRLARYSGSCVQRSRSGGRFALAAVLVLFGCQSLQTAVADGDTRSLSFQHTHRDDSITVTFKRNGRYDEDGLKKLNHFLRDWRNNDETADGSAAVRHPVGSLPRCRREGAGHPHHLVLPLAGDQRDAAPPQPRRRAVQPAHARQGDRLLHSGRAARSDQGGRPAPAAWRRRLLSELRVRARRRRQHPALAAHDARPTRPRVPGRQDRPCPVRRPSAEELFGRPGRGAAARQHAVGDVARRCAKRRHQDRRRKRRSARARAQCSRQAARNRLQRRGRGRGDATRPRPQGRRRVADRGLTGGPASADAARAAGEGQRILRRLDHQTGRACRTGEAGRVHAGLGEHLGGADARPRSSTRAGSGRSRPTT